MLMHIKMHFNCKVKLIQKIISSATCSVYKAAHIKWRIPSGLCLTFRRLLDFFLNSYILSFFVKRVWSPPLRARALFDKARLPQGERRLKVELQTRFSQTP